MKFIVDRQTWHRGKGEQDSYLLRRDGMRCCIGFVAQQCGVPDEQLLANPAIHHSKVYAGPLIIDAQHLELLPKWMSLGDHTSPPLAAAYATNDEPNISDEDREQKLQSIFTRNGDEIEFIN